MTKFSFSLALSFLVVVFSTLSVFLIFPNYFRYQTLSTEYVRKQSVVEARQANFELFEETYKEVLQLKERIDEQIKQIPPMRNLNHLIVKLGISFSDYGLQETDFSLGRTTFFTPEGTDFLVGRTTVALSGVGTCESIMAFIGYLHEADEYYQIDNLQMSSENVLREGNIFIKLDITIYTTDEEGAEELPYVEHREFRNPFDHP